MGKVIDLGPFRRAQRKKQEEFATHLLKGHIAQTLAIDRVCLELMQADLDKGQAAFAHFFDPPLPGTVGSPAFRWALNSEYRAMQILIPSYRDPDAYKRQEKEFKAYADQLRARVERAYKTIHDTKYSTELWVIRRNLPTKLVIGKIANALEDYLRTHQVDDNILHIRPDVAVWKMLDEERRDLAVMLRLATQIPLDISTYTIRTKEPDLSLVELAQLAVSTVIYAIPVIGNAVAAFEAWRGKDIWGHELSDFDRAVLAASVLLPLAGRAIKQGKALYTSERMARLYGEDARQWSYAMALGEHASADAAGLRRIKEASQKVAKNQAIPKTAAEKLAETFRTLGLDQSGKALVPFTIDAKLVEAFERVAVKHPQLKTLDAFAMERLVAKGVQEYHVKGQLLEELLEERITALLRDPHGRVALGLGHVEGELRFVPGHLIRDAEGLQITDGMIVRQLEERIHIVAVFEAKSGTASSRGLASKSTSSSKLSTSAREERAAEARESIRELEERARLEGKPPPKVSLDEQIKKIILSEQGGQIRSDIERLSEQKLWINGVEMPVEVQSGPRSTKFFGVLPSDVRGTSLLQSLSDVGLKNVDILGMDITEQELIRAAKTTIKEMAAFLPK